MEGITGQQGQKGNMLTQKEVATMDFSDAILNVIDNQEQFTRSDLQGSIEALVRGALDFERSGRYPFKPSFDKLPQYTADELTAAQARHIDDLEASKK